MKKDVEKAIAIGVSKRKKVLSELSYEQRKSLLELLFQDFFIDQHALLQKWAALTGQTAQIDTGYIAQFIASIVLGIPGQGFRGKGFDLVDGSEVKSAANISGVDRPRWNHNLGKLSEDEARRKKGQPTVGEEYLSSPNLFYLLVDRKTVKQGAQPIRVRAWCIDAQNDEAWRNLLKTYLASREGTKYNFQLHPPVGHDDDIVVNTLGNLDFADVLVFDYQITFEMDGNSTGSWVVDLPEDLSVITGRTVAKPYGGRSARPSNYTNAEDIVADVSILPNRFPGIIGAAIEDALDDLTEDELQA